MKTSDSVKTCHTLTSSAEASPARTSAPQAPCRGLKGHAAVCSMKLPASFTRLSPDMSCWRTSQRSLITVWQVFSGQWPAAGIMLDGACYQLQTWAPHTSGKDGSVLRGWPTPVKGDHRCAAPNQNTVTCGREVRRLEGNSRLNPEWVEMLMGFPAGWTAISGPHDQVAPSTHTSLHAQGSDNSMTSKE